MAGRLKKLKEPPLLNPPGPPQESWMRLRESDIPNIESFFTAVRNVDKPTEASEIARYHFHMRQLGIGVEITREDRGKMAAGLEDARKKSDGLSIARFHFYMARLGIGERVTNNDRVNMKSAINKLAKRVEPGAQSNAFWLAEQYYLLNELGINKSVQQPHRGILENGLHFFSSNSKGTGGQGFSGMLTPYYYYIIKLGLKDKVEEGDILPMREHLEKSRIPSIRIVDDLFYLNELFQPADPHSSQPLPPLKEF